MTPEQIAARLQEIAERRQDIGEEFRTLNDEAGDNALEGEHAERWTALETEDDALIAEVADLEKRRTRLESIERAAQDPRNVSPGSVTPPNINTRDSEDPFAVEEIRSGDREAEIRGRTLTAIERADYFVSHDDRRISADDCREQMTKLVQRSGGTNRKGLAEQILATLSPHYRDAFFKLASGRGESLTEQERQALERAREHNERALALTNVTGKLVPSFLDPTIVLTNDGALDPFRQRCRVEQGTTNVWTGVSSAGVTAGWTGVEGTEVGDDSPSFANPSVTAYMADAFVPISFQAYEDWSGGTQELLTMFSDARDRLEATAHATGSGSNQPTGLVTALDANTNVELETTTSNVFGLVDVFATYEALPVRWRAAAEWFANISIINDIRQFGTDALSTQTVDLTAAGVPQVLGRRVNEATAMDGVIAAGGEDSFLVIGDPRNYLIYDRVGMMYELVPNLFGATNQRPVLRRGHLVHWRTGADSINDLAFRLLQAHTNS